MQSYSNSLETENQALQRHNRGKSCENQEWQFWTDCVKISLYHALHDKAAICLIFLSIPDVV